MGDDVGAGVRFEYAADISGGPRVRAETMGDLVKAVCALVTAGAEGFVILGAMSCRVSAVGLPIYSGRVLSWNEVERIALARLG